jgi:uncharacterized protein YbgA (DUF1722 family)
VQVAHEQARAVFAEFSLRDIFTAFISKMDNIEQMSEREKREVGKLYAAFVDAYKTQILTEQYYEKLLESLSRKAVGVSDVLAHICKVFPSYTDSPQPHPGLRASLSLCQRYPQYLPHSP